MTAKEVFKARAELEYLERAASTIALNLSDAALYAARGGAFVGTIDWMRDPEYVAAVAAVDAKRAVVTEMETAIGGVVYRVVSYKVETLTKKLDKLAKRAKTNGLGELSYRVTDEEDIVEVKEFGRVVEVHRYRFVVLAAARLKLAGWALLAKLSIEEAGVLVSKVPAFSRAWTLHREGITEEAPSWSNDGDPVVSAVKEELDAINLGVFADPKTASNCDYCGLSRRRTATYVVECLEDNAEKGWAKGDLKRVGSNCLRDFLGVDPNALAKYAELLSVLEDEMGDEDEERGWGSGSKPEVPTLDYLIHVCTMLRTVGWVARSAGGFATADAAESNRYSMNRRELHKGRPAWVDPTDADEARAADAIEWAKDHFGAKANLDGGMYGGRSLSDFDRNLLIAAGSTVVTPKIMGTLAYLPVAHARFLEKEIEIRKEREKVADSVHVGSAGDRLDLTLTVEKVFETEGDYGVTFITALSDADGNSFKWFGSYELKLDATYSAKWTVKKHSEFKGVKETVITRPAKLALVETAALA